MMDARVSQIIKCFDRLAHPSTNDTDVLNTVQGIRRRLGNETMSNLLAKLPGHVDQTEIKKLRAVIDNLHGELAALEEENDELLTLQSDLEYQLQQVQRAASMIVDREARETYTDYEVVRIKQQRFGKTHGIDTRWAAFSAARHAADPSSPIVTVSKTQQWRRAGCFPSWAVEQLWSMPTIIEREIYTWSSADVDYLCDLYNEAPNLSYLKLATKCAEKFGVPIGENSIRSKLRYLRQKNRISPARKRLSS
jgi:hypothetical protein